MAQPAHDQRLTIEPSSRRPLLVHVVLSRLLTSTSRPRSRQPVLSSPFVFIPDFSTLLSFRATHSNLCREDRYSLSYLLFPSPSTISVSLLGMYFSNRMNFRCTLQVHRLRAWTRDEVASTRFSQLAPTRLPSPTLSRMIATPTDISTSHLKSERPVGQADARTGGRPARGAAYEARDSGVSLALSC